MAFNPAPAPKTALGHYRMLAPTGSIRVSPLCLGRNELRRGLVSYFEDFPSDTCLIGLSRKSLWESAIRKRLNKSSTFSMKSGGNFIDTANNYQKEESEIKMVIATKFTTCFRAGYGERDILINTTGNGAKSLHLSVEASLKKLHTSYIDLVCLSVMVPLIDII
jgi:aryl-alcohol dehydrogenase-like predicted oxidoreductase